MRHGESVAVAVGREPPVVAVIYHADAEDGAPADSGFDILFSDAPDNLDELDPEDDRLQTVCLHCVIEDYPEAGRGMDLALKHGYAERDLDTGEWSV